MALEPWNPWNEIERLQAETNRLWERLLAKLHAAEPPWQPITFVPAVDLVETPCHYRVYLSLPGLLEEDMDLLCHRDAVLIVRGERESPYGRQQGHRCLAEQRYGFFERRIEFSQPVDFATLQASYDAGILVIVVRKKDPP
jgi:HSP20 family molecular chaperone IbpA